MGSAPEEGPTKSYELRQLRIGEKSPLSGITIRTSGIRERFDSMVVGIEHAGQRVINPKSDLQLYQGDTLWIVGEKRNLDSLTVELFKT